MVHVLAPRPPISGVPVFYNVDTSVGRNGMNSSIDDILLVQYFLSLIGKVRPRGPISAPLPTFRSRAG